jgi:hypothetical protein
MPPHTQHWLQEIFLSTGVLWRCWRTLSNVLGPEIRGYINVPLQCVPHP